MKNLFIRSKNNPILRPAAGHDWESVKVYNCGAVYDDGQYHLFYRAVGADKISRIGYAVSEDGEKFKRFDRPMLEPEAVRAGSLTRELLNVCHVHAKSSRKTAGLQLEKKGIEDPRVVKIDNELIMTYTAYDGQTARLCSAVLPANCLAKPSEAVRKIYFLPGFSRLFRKNNLFKSLLKQGRNKYSKVFNSLRSCKIPQCWQKRGEMIPDWDFKKAGGFVVEWDQAQMNPVAEKKWIKAGGIFPEKIKRHSPPAAAGETMAGQGEYNKSPQSLCGVDCSGAKNEIYKMDKFTQMAIEYPELGQKLTHTH